MSYCQCCGSPVPEDQNMCSMCYGDPSYGRDGYYEEYLKQVYQNRMETMNELLQEFKQKYPGLTRHEEFLKLNELEHWYFLYGEKQKEKYVSALKQEFYADEQKAHDEAWNEIKRMRDEKDAAEAKARAEAEKKRREDEAAKQSPQRGVGYMTVTFTAEEPYTGTKGV